MTKPWGGLAAWWHILGYSWKWGRWYHWQVAVDIIAIEHHLSLDVRFIPFVFEDASKTQDHIPNHRMMFVEAVWWCNCTIVESWSGGTRLSSQQEATFSRYLALWAGQKMGSCHRFVYKVTERPPRAVASQASEVYQSRKQNKGTCGCLSQDVQKTRMGQMKKCFNYRQDVVLLYILLLRTWVMELMVVGAKRWKSLGLHQQSLLFWRLFAADHEVPPATIISILDCR